MLKTTFSVYIVYNLTFELEILVKQVHTWQILKTDLLLTTQTKTKKGEKTHT